jgi:OTU domain-containing protein 6
LKIKNGEEEAEDEITPEMLLAQLELEQKEQEQTGTASNENEEPQQRPKRNRQKERLQRRQAEIDQKKAEAEAEAAEQPNLKDIEQEHLDQLCQLQGVQQFDIQPDGNCLFSSIADQLDTRHGIKVTVQELRTRSANHIRNDPVTFTPYLFDEDTMSVRDIKEYTEKMEKTSAWGSDLEILALAKEYDCPISVMMSGRSTLKINEDGNGEELKLVYYKHSYALGEHYNSLRDVAK